MMRCYVLQFFALVLILCLFLHIHILKNSKELKEKGILEINDFCEIEIGMKHDEIERIVGSPNYISNGNHIITTYVLSDGSRINLIFLSKSGPLWDMLIVDTTGRKFRLISADE